MKTKVKVITTLSVAGGLAVVLAACGMHRFNSTPEKRADYFAEKITRKLELDETQATRLTALKEELLAAVRRMSSEKEKAHDEVTALLEHPTLDRQRALQLVTERTRAVEEEAPAVIAALGDFYDSLTPDQRQKLRDRFKEHKEGHRGFFHHH